MGVKFDTFHPHPNPPPKWGGNYCRPQHKCERIIMLRAFMLRSLALYASCYVPSCCAPSPFKGEGWDGGEMCTSLPPP